MVQYTMFDFVAELGSRLSRLFAVSPCFLADNWDFHVIINLKAGGFSKRSAQVRFLRRFDATLGNVFLAPGVAKEFEAEFHVTDGPGHASLIAATLANAYRDKKRRPFVMSVGGDGTHQETFSGFMAVDAAARARLLAFRFPAGTGNDAADAWNLEQAVTALRDGCPAVGAGAIEFNSPKRDRHYSFNIASIGVDAYVVHLTNKLKHWLPGDFYKPLTNIGVLFYERIHGIFRMIVEVYRHDAPAQRLERHNGILAFGVSGWRTYGSDKWVLPGEDNVCAIEKGNVLRNLELKRHLFKASHPSLPYTFMARANRLVVAYPGRIPLQLDGEVLWLDASDFPFEFRVVETGVSVLSAKQGSKLQAYTYEFLKAQR